MEENLIGTACHGELYEATLGDGRIVTVKKASVALTVDDGLAR